MALPSEQARDALRVLKGGVDEVASCKSGSREPKVGCVRRVTEWERKLVGALTACLTLSFLICP